MMLEGSWSIDLEKYKVDDPSAPMVFSKQFKEILGYSENSTAFPDIMQSYISCIHSDDLEIASTALGEFLATPHYPPVFDKEYRMKKSNGDYVWVRTLNTVIWNENNTKPIMVAGTILDITEEKINKMRFQNELAPKIDQLRSGITSIVDTIDIATNQMNDISEKQKDVISSTNAISKSVSESMGIISSIKNIADQTNLLSKQTSEDVSSENENMARIDETAKALHQFANDIGDIVSTLYK